MNPEHAPLLFDPCPDPETLAVFSVGKLSAEETERVAAHLDRCDRCEDVLESLGDDDTLVAAPRLHVPTDPDSDDNPVQEVSRRASAEPGSASTIHERGPKRRLGPYELLEKIGQGAMGVVYKARQVGLNRLVALKLALPGELMPFEIRARFRTESEAIARLKHPNIVCVYDCGEQDGYPYFSMELIEGQSLAQKLKEGPLPARAAAELVRTLAHAVAFAHQQKVIHRDLKPANVLIAADGSVKLTDFGLAKLLDAEDGQTQPETVMGTASYMAPEQRAATSPPLAPWPMFTGWVRFCTRHLRVGLPSIPRRERKRFARCKRKSPPRHRACGRGYATVWRPSA